MLNRSYTSGYSLLLMSSLVYLQLLIRYLDLALWSKSSYWFLLLWGVYIIKKSLTLKKAALTGMNVTLLLTEGQQWGNKAACLS